LRAAGFFVAVLRFRVTAVARRALLALLALRALRALRAAVALRGPLAFRAFRAMATVFFRAALFLAVRRARDFARVDPFFLVAAALRLAIAVVLSPTGLP